MDTGFDVNDIGAKSIHFRPREFRSIIKKTEAVDENEQTIVPGDLSTEIRHDCIHATLRNGKRLVASGQT